MVDTRDGVAIEEQIDCFEMKEVDLEGVEELEKAIAPVFSDSAAAATWETSESSAASPRLGVFG